MLTNLIFSMWWNFFYHADTCRLADNVEVGEIPRKAYLYTDRCLSARKVGCAWRVLCWSNWSASSLFTTGSTYTAMIFIGLILRKIALIKTKISNKLTLTADTYHSPELFHPLRWLVCRFFSTEIRAWSEGWKKSLKLASSTLIYIQSAFNKPSRAR